MEQQRGWGGVGGQVLGNYCTKEQTVTHHNQTRISCKTPLEINFFLQVAQFIVEIPGRDTPVCQRRRGGGWQKKKMEERASLFLCAPQDLHAQSDPAVP